MARIVRRHWDEEDIWFYFELDEQGWVTRHVELLGPERTPTAAVSLREGMRELDAGRIQQYQARYGVVAEGPLTPEDLPDWHVVPAAEFEELWQAARACLEG